MTLLAVGVSLALLATACGGGGDSTDPEPGTHQLDSAPGFDGKTIKLGFLGDQSGNLAVLGQPLRQGVQVYWDWLNSQGGVAGKFKVELVVGDTMDDSDKTVAEYQQIKDDVVMLAAVLSTPPTQALLKFLQEDNIVAMPGSFAGAWSGEAVLLPFGAAYEYEMINLVDWYVKDSALATDNDAHCAVYVADKYGEDSMRGVYYAIEQLGLTLAEEQTISRGDEDFTAQLEALKQAECTVVYTVSVPTEQNIMLEQAKSMGFEPHWLASLPTYLNLVAGSSPENYSNFYVALDAPAIVEDPSQTEVPGMKKFVERFNEHAEGTPNSFHLWGYSQMVAVHALLEKAAELGDLSRAGIAEAMTQLGKVEFEGLVAEDYVYGPPESRVPTSGVRIFRFDATQQPNLLREIQLYDSELNEDFVLAPAGDG